MQISVYNARSAARCGARNGDKTMQSLNAAINYQRMSAMAAKLALELNKNVYPKTVLINQIAAAHYAALARREMNID